TTDGRKRLLHPKLQPVVRAMEDNLEVPLTISELAALVHVSVRQLERLFRRYLSQSPGRFYADMRLKRAHDLLHRTNMPLIDIAMACGFSSPSHFAKRYRLLYGVSPSQLRQQKACL
ncbi:helix-turn-helix domain-containing protein, partial [Cognatishimia sp. SS12]|uniref:helix-turn-helix domain-containing protein n=1 Tax=Cognatishimia sp. SS12 TaxID=2979465 RepID=UPI00232DD49A